jgi:DinB superfamily
MTSAELLADAFGRVREVVHDVVAGLTPEQLAFRVDADANSIAWLLWHLTRIQDDHVSDVAGTEQVWTAQGWVERFGLSFDAGATGYGHTSDDVAAVTVGSGDVLVGYYDAVHEQTIRFVQRITDADLDRIVDERWDPPVTLGVRLVSVIEDDLQHGGQAAFVRGIVVRTSPA